VNLFRNSKDKDQMEAVNFGRKREGVYPLIASLCFSLVLFPQFSLAEEGFPAPVPAPVQEQAQSPTPPDISPPAIEPEKPIIKEEQAVPNTPPVQEPAPSQTPPEAPPPVKVPEKKVAGEENVVPQGPPIMLSLKKAINTALTGNRPYLDRLDSIRQNQGLGQVAGTVQIVQTASGDLQIPITGNNGLAAAEAQFQTNLLPTFSVTRNQTTPELETYGLQVNKQFITGATVGLTSTTGSTQFENFSSSLTAQFAQPLLQGAWPFVVGEPIAFAKSQLFQVEFNAICCEDSSKQGVIFNVISQYYGIKNQTELVEIAKKAVERAERLFKATQAKQNVELATQLDVSRAEVQLSTQQVAYNQAVQDLGNKLETFKVLLGLNSKETVELTDEIVYQPLEEIIKEEDLPKFIETAMKNRPDLKAQQLRIGDSERSLRIARNRLLPNLSTTYNYTVNNIGGLDSKLGGNSKVWSAGFNLSYPLPLTQTKVTIEANAVQLRRTERDFVEKKESIKKDVNNDLRNVVKLQEQIPIVKTQIESAEKKLKIANFRFDRGLASNFDIVDAENNLILARQSLTKTIADYLVAKNQLKRDTGVLTDDQ
jgi:outer membrane protein TolC